MGRGKSTIARFGVCVTLLGMLAVGMTPTAIPSSGAAHAAETRDEALTRFGEVYGILNNNHVSGVTDEGLTDAAIQGMIASLNDPYTVYFSKPQWEQYQNDLNMKFVGIGALLTQNETGTFIVEVYEGSPAQEAGLLAGDRITEVNGKSTSGLTLEQIVEAVRGPESSEVLLMVARKDNNALTFKALRREVLLPSVASRKLSDQTGYIQLTGFTERSDEEFAAAIKQLSNQGITGLIVDLRNNPGGLLESAQHIAEQFIPEGTLIHTRDRNGIDHPVLLTNGQSLSIPVAFLVNEGSASASEVLSGAVQDYRKATIVGSLTYGKGSVQSIYKLSSGGAVKVTIEQYMTPLGKPVNGVGITPDIAVQGSIPQFVTALREAKSTSIRVGFINDRVEINGLFMSERISPVWSSGVLYAPARILASMVGGQLVWNETTEAIEVTSPVQQILGAAGPSVVSYDVNNGYLNQDGVGFIDVSLFQKQFPQLTYSSVDSQVVLMIETGKENR